MRQAKFAPLPERWTKAGRITRDHYIVKTLVTTEMLGKAKIPDLPYEQPDGKPYRIDTDYFGNKRKTNNPYPGPFNEPKEGKQLIKVWPRK